MIIKLSKRFVFFFQIQLNIKIIENFYYILNYNRYKNYLLFVHFFFLTARFQLDIF